MTVSKGSSLVVVSPESVCFEEVFTMYLPFCFAILLTVLLRRRVALEAFTMPSKICQLPPSICCAPSAAIQTIVSRP